MSVPVLRRRVKAGKAPAEKAEGPYGGEYRIPTAWVEKEQATARLVEVPAGRVEVAAALEQAVRRAVADELKRDELVDAIREAVRAEMRAHRSWWPPWRRGDRGTRSHD